METAMTADDRCREIIDDLSRDRFTAETRRALLRELTHKASGFRAGELIAIASAVTGERCKSGDAALDAIERWTRERAG